MIDHRFMTDDGEGNWVFFHYGHSRHSYLDPKYFGTNKANTQEKKLLGKNPQTFYYTMPDFVEPGIGSICHQVRIPKDKVFFVERHLETKKGLTADEWLAKLSKEAVKRGYHITVARWFGGRKETHYRAQTTKLLKAYKERYTNTRVVQTKKESTT